MFSKTYYAQNYAGIIGLGLNVAMYIYSYIPIVQSLTEYHVIEQISYIS